MKKSPHVPIIAASGLPFVGTARDNVRAALVYALIITGGSALFALLALGLIPQLGGAK